MDNFEQLLTRAQPQIVVAPYPENLVERVRKLKELGRMRRLFQLLWVMAATLTILVTPWKEAGYLSVHIMLNRIYLNALVQMLPWLHLAGLTLISCLIAAVYQRETFLQQGGRRSIKRSLTSMHIIPNLTRATVVTAVLGTSIMGASVYAYATQDNASAALQQLKQVVDSRGNVTYTIDGQTYVVNPKIKNVAGRVQAVAIQQATEKQMMQFLTAKGYRNAQGVVTAPNGDNFATMVGKVTSLQNGSMTFDTGSHFGGPYTVALAADTSYFNGDKVASQASLHLGDSITTVFAIDQTTYGAGAPKNVTESIARLQQAKKTAYIVTLVPYDADDYINALLEGGIQAQPANGLPLQTNSDGFAPTTVISQ